MKPITTLHPTSQAWLSNSVLAPHMDAFAAHLENGRYAATTTKRYIAGIAHFARWMTQSCLPLQMLDEHGVDQFLSHHMARCDCPPPALLNLPDLRAALHHLLNVLRNEGIISERSSPTGHIADELHRYDEHMLKARGLSSGTRHGQLHVIEKLLLYKFANRPVVIGELCPDDVRHFISSQLQLKNTASNASTLTSALRAYLRYRATCGDQVHGLLGVILSPAHWGHASLPRALKPIEVERLLASFTPSLSSHRRGYAIVRCALDMGLRSSEIANLQLADIDWDAGTITLKRTKSLRQDILPLPELTGQALAEYVKQERPMTTSTAVFVRCRARRDLPLGVNTVRYVIRDAYQRIGLTHGRSHALRHTLACQLIDHGSSLKEVADVLRHRSLNTSLIYAKLDATRLGAVALPWPGSAK